MASSTGDFNWGFLAKAFMDKFKDQGNEPVQKTRKPKRKLPTTQAMPSMFMNSGPRVQPADAIAPCRLHSSQWAVFTQFETLRMQLLRQLVVYQKQLLALRMPMLPAPTAQDSADWPKNQRSKRKASKLSAKKTKKHSNPLLVNTQYRPTREMRQPLVDANNTTTKNINKPKKLRKTRKSKRFENEGGFNRSQKWPEHQSCQPQHGFLPLAPSFQTASDLKGQNHNAECVQENVLPGKAKGYDNLEGFRSLAEPQACAEQEEHGRVCQKECHVSNGRDGDDVLTRTILDMTTKRLEELNRANNLRLKDTLFPAEPEKPVRPKRKFLPRKIYGKNNKLREDSPNYNTLLPTPELTDNC